jgi:hypothetical protein
MFAKSYPEHLANIQRARAMIAARAESTAVETTTAVVRDTSHTPPRPAKM